MSENPFPGMRILSCWEGDKNSDNIKAGYAGMRMKNQMWAGDGIGFPGSYSTCCCP